MLNPNHRSLYTSALTPPPGMTFDQAVGATFSSDPTLMLSIPVYLAFLAKDQKDNIKDGAMVLESIRRTAGRVIIFAQRGRALVPDVPNPLYGLLESILVEVIAPRGGLFHPKLWLIRYVDPSGINPPLMRLLVLSRNLTNDHSWDLSLQLEGYVGKRYHTENKEIAKFLTSLPELSFVDVDPKKRQNINQMADDLRRTKWELPPGFESLHFYILGLKNGSWPQLPSKKMVVVSPFCTDEALNYLVDKSAAAKALISRPETLNILNPETIQRFSRCLTLDEAAESEDGEATEETPSTDSYGLHAKAYIYERGWYTHFVIGSANATNAAMLNAKNVEVLVELVGRKSRVGGIENLLNDDGLGEILNDHITPDESLPGDPERQAAEEAIETARQMIAIASLKLHCEPDMENTAWQMRMLGFIEPFENIGQARVWPITVSESNSTPLDPLFTNKQLILGNFSASSLTGLIAFELRSHHPKVSARFVMNLPVEGMPDARETAILQTVIRNKEGFIRYLLLLLSGFEDTRTLLFNGKVKDLHSFGFGGTNQETPLLEELTRAYSRDPNRLREVSYIIRQLSKHKIDNPVVPPEFLSLWKVFEEALEEHDG